MSTRYIEVTPHLRLTAAEAELVGSEAIDALRHEYGECVTWRGRTRKNGVAHPLLPEVLSYVGRYIAKVVHAAATHVTIHIGHEANLNLRFEVLRPVHTGTTPLTEFSGDNVLAGNIVVALNWDYIFQAASKIEIPPTETELFDRLKYLIWQLTEDSRAVYGIDRAPYSRPFGKLYSLVNDELRLRGYSSRFDPAASDERFIKYVADRAVMLPLKFAETPEGELIFNYESLYRRAMEADRLQADGVQLFIALAYAVSHAQFTIGDRLSLGRALSRANALSLLDYATKMAERPKNDMLDVADAAIEGGNEHFAKLTSAAFAKYRYIFDGLQAHREGVIERLTEETFRRSIG